jgi:hypothetical protein
MSPKKSDPRSNLEADETFELKPKSDEARLQQKGALMPERPRDGTAEASDLHDLAQRAVESGEDPEAPLNFEHPSSDARDDEDTEDESTEPG